LFETFESFGAFPFCSSGHHEGLMASTKLTKLEAVTFIRHGERDYIMILL